MFKITAYIMPMDQIFEIQAAATKFESEDMVMMTYNLMDKHASKMEKVFEKFHLVWEEEELLEDDEMMGTLTGKYKDILAFLQTVYPGDKLKELNSFITKVEGATNGGHGSNSPPYFTILEFKSTDLKKLQDVASDITSYYGPAETDGKIIHIYLPDTAIDEVVEFVEHEMKNCYGVELKKVIYNSGKEKTY